MKYLTFSDCHANSNLVKFKKSLDQMKGYIKENPVEAIFFGMDLFDSKVVANEDYKFIIDEFSDLANYAPLIMGYGTRSHDHEGSLDILENVKTKYPIKVVNDVYEKDVEGDEILGWGLRASSGAESRVWNSYTKKNILHRKGYQYPLLVFVLSWADKARFLTKEELKLSIKEQDELFNKKLQEWIDKRIALGKKLQTPTFLVAHLQDINAIPSFGQDVASNSHDLKMFEGIADKFCLGHIHKPDDNYNGNIFNKTFGERERKSFRIIETDDYKIISDTRIPFDTPFMHKEVLDGMEAYRDFQDSMERDVEGDVTYELWIDLTLPNKEIFDYDVELKWWKSHKWIETIRLDVSQQSTQVVTRLQEYNSEMSLVEKFLSWCKEKEIVPSDFQINKIKELE